MTKKPILCTFSIGNPQEAMGVDVGNGTIVRYNEQSREVVGMTFVGLRDRFIKQMQL